MSSLTTTISVQMDTKDKEKATKILQKLGVSMSGLINMTIKQLIMRESIPFDVSIPKKEDKLTDYFSPSELDATAKELEEVEKNPNKYKKYDNVEDLFEDLNRD